MSAERRRAQLRQVGPTGREIHALKKTLSKSPRHIYIYRDSEDSRDVLVSNYALEGRDGKLVGVYDHTVTAAMLREDLYGISQAEYRKTVRVGRPRKLGGET